MLPIRDATNAHTAAYSYTHSYPYPYTDSDTYTHAHPNPNTHSYSYTYTDTYATRQVSVYSVGDTGGGNVVCYCIHKLIKLIYIFLAVTHVFGVSQRHHMYWRDGVHLWRWALCRVLSIWLLLRLLTADSYAHSDAHTHPNTYANAYTYPDAKVPAWHHMYWRDGVRLRGRALCPELSIRLLLSVPVSAV
jgi:hypothetical protein